MESDEEDVEIQIETCASHEENPAVPHTAQSEEQRRDAPQRQGDGSATSVDASDTDPGGDDRQPAAEVRNGLGGTEEEEEPVVEEDRPEALEPEVQEAEGGNVEAEHLEEAVEEPAAAPTLRRSSRDRRPPPWTASGEFVMSSQCTRQTEQDVRLHMLLELSAAGMLKTEGLADVLRSVLRE